MKKLTILDLKSMKNRQKIVAITAYDGLFANIFDPMVDLILVGDSLNMSFNLKDETIGLEVDQMIYHAKAVKNGVKKAFLVVDMPFGSISTPKKALKNAIEIYKKTGCDAVKVEGGIELSSTVELLTQNGINVVSHIGLMPQMSRFDGGYKIKGRDGASAKKILDDALALEKAGAVMVVLEGIISPVAQKITKSLNIPTIGIGSGVGCDGQVLVWSDAFGFYDKFQPKFVKRYLDGASLIKGALQDYVNEVRNGVFPGDEHEYK